MHNKSVNLSMLAYFSSHWLVQQYVCWLQITMYNRWDCLSQNNGHINGTSKSSIRPREQRDSVFNLPLHEDIQFHAKYQEQFEVFLPNSKNALHHLETCTVGMFIIKELNSKKVVYIESVFLKRKLFFNIC